MSLIQFFAHVRLDDMKRVKMKGANIGTSSIMIIIVTLTLICFAGLSLSSASADYKLCKKLSDRTAAYYEATSKAYTELAKKIESSENTKDSFDTKVTINEYQEFWLEAVINPDDNCRYILKNFSIETVKEPKLDTSLSLLLPTD